MSKVHLKTTVLKLLLAYCVAAFVAGIVANPDFESFGAVRATVLVYLVFPFISLHAVLTGRASQDLVLFAVVFVGASFCLAVVAYVGRRKDRNN